MSGFKKLSHTIYDCKYHIVFCPKYRYRICEGQIGEYAKQQVYFLVRQKDLVEVEEINVQPDHVHMILSVPPKYAISDIMGFNVEMELTPPQSARAGSVRPMHLGRQGHSHSL